MNSGVEYIEQQLGSNIHDGEIKISVRRYFDIIKEAKKLESELIEEEYYRDKLINIKK
jgi:hypothetical protein